MSNIDNPQFSWGALMAKEGSDAFNAKWAPNRFLAPAQSKRRDIYGTDYDLMEKGKYGTQSVDFKSYTFAIVFQMTRSTRLVTVPNPFRRCDTKYIFIYNRTYNLPDEYTLQQYMDKFLKNVPVQMMWDLLRPFHNFNLKSDDEFWPLCDEVEELLTPYLKTGYVFERYKGDNPRKTKDFKLHIVKQ